MFTKPVTAAYQDVGQDILLSYPNALKETLLFTDIIYVYVCVYVYIRICVCVCIYIYIRIYTHICCYLLTIWGGGMGWKKPSLMFFTCYYLKLTFCFFKLLPVPDHLLVYSFLPKNCHIYLFRAWDWGWAEMRSSGSCYRGGGNIWCRPGTCRSLFTVMLKQDNNNAH